MSQVPGPTRESRTDAPDIARIHISVENASSDAIGDDYLRHFVRQVPGVVGVVWNPSAARLCVAVKDAVRGNAVVHALEGLGLHTHVTDQCECIDLKI